MNTKKQTNIMRHKSFHTQSFWARQRIEMMRQKEDLKIRDMQTREKERQKEIEERYYRDLEAKAGVHRKERLDWMYEFSGGPQDKAGEGQQAATIEEMVTSASGADEEAAKQKILVVDVENKMREDPMLGMEQKRLQLLQQRFADPMRALQLQKKRQELAAALKDDEDDERKGKKAKKAKKAKKSKKEKKEKKDKRQHGKRAASSDASSLSDAESDHRSGALRRSSRDRDYDRGGRRARSVSSSRDGHRRGGSRGRDVRSSRRERSYDSRDGRSSRRDRSRSFDDRGRRGDVRSRDHADRRDDRGRDGRRRERSRSHDNRRGSRDRRERSRSHDGRDRRGDVRRGRDEDRRRDDRRVSAGRDRSRDDERVRPSAPVQQQQQQQQQGRRPRRAPMTSEERAERLRGMEQAARDWDTEKKVRIETAAADEAARDGENKTGGAQYMQQFTDKV